MTVVPARVAGVARDRRRLARRSRRRQSTRSCSARPGCSRSTRFVVAGGAQAIGALAYGLPDAGLEPVDRIVGPGNAWVTAAKIEVCGEVGIDLPAGPSEGMVLAAPPADPRRVAADLDHPGRARPRLPGDPRHDGRRRSPTPSSARSRALLAARRTPRHPRPRPRATTAGSSSPRTSTPRSTSSTPTRPEHLSVDVEPLEPTVARLRNAGSMFVGPWAPESAGDYATGANHVLPTGGLARASGALAVEAYGKFIQVQRIDREGLAGDPPRRSRTLAEAEGLLAHRDAVEIRFEDAEADR